MFEKYHAGASRLSIMRPEEREFYLRSAVMEGWSRRELER